MNLARLALALALALAGGRAGLATPIDVPIVITDCSQPAREGVLPAICAPGPAVNCTFTAPLYPGTIVFVLVLENPADTGISYGLSGQDAPLFAVQGSDIVVGATALNPSAATTYNLGAQSIPAVNFTAYCGPGATSGPQPP